MGEEGGCPIEGPPGGPGRTLEPGGGGAGKTGIKGFTQLWAFSHTEDTSRGDEKS